MTKREISFDLNKISPIPIKKSYDYYKHFGNSWDSKYLSCPKVSKYYIDPHESFLSGPFSPRQLSVVESNERAQVLQEKMLKNKLASRQRLIQRKKERELVSNKQIQHKSRQSQEILFINKLKLGLNRPLTTVFNRESIILDRRKLRSSTIDETIRENEIMPFIMERINRSKERFGNKCFSPIRLRNNLKRAKEDASFNTKCRKSVRKARQSLGSRTRHLAGFRKFSTYSVDDRYQYIDRVKEDDRVDRLKLQEILNELEEFEIQYAERVKEKHRIHRNL